MQISHTAPDISLILPAFNEVVTIAATVCEAARYFESRSLRYELIVSADGSDGTREAARALHHSAVRVIGENARRGKGRGIREGVLISTGAVVGFADADNKVPIEEFDKIRPCLAEGFDVVIGSRAMGQSTIERPQPLYRRIGARGFSV